MCVLLTLLVCLPRGLTSLRGMFTRFLYFCVSFCVCLWFSFLLCIYLSFSILALSVYESFFFTLSLSLSLWSSHSKTPDLTLEVLLVNHTWSLPRVWTLFLGMHALPRSDSFANDPWLLAAPAQELWFTWGDIQFKTTQTFATFLSWKQLTVAVSNFFLSRFLLLRTPPPLFLWLLSSHKQWRFTAKRMMGVWRARCKIVQ